jgi:glycerol-3-phosphate dehydrogenase
VVVQDVMSDKKFELHSKVVINATGVFTDEILKLDNLAATNIVSPSQGIHLVLDKKYFPGTEGMMIPKTSDGRVLFAVSWHDKVVVGTTDTPIENHAAEPKPLEEEIEFIIQHINKYLDIEIKRTDVKSVFVGLRPLVKKGSSGKTAIMPRDHTIITSASGLVTITGGKWTTYRRMAKDVVDKAVLIGGLQQSISATEYLKIHGWINELDANDALHFYGSDAEYIKNLCRENNTWSERIHSSFPNIKAEIIWAVRNEMAINIEDVLARRTRLLFLDAEAAIQSATITAALMANEMDKDAAWQQKQIESFNTLAKQYLLS